MSIVRAQKSKSAKRTHCNPKSSIPGRKVQERCLARCARVCVTWGYAWNQTSWWALAERRCARAQRGGVQRRSTTTTNTRVHFPQPQSITDSRAYHKIKLWGKPLEPRDLTETLERRRPSRRLRLARWSEPASVPFSRNALYYLSQEKRGSSTCLKSKLEELEGREASSSKGRMRAQRRRLATC